MRMETRSRNIVAGSLLGDGWLGKLTKRSGNCIYTLKYNDRSIGYLQWMRTQLQELHPSELKSIPRYTQHYFYTKARSDIGDLRKKFYPHEGSKRVPENIGDILYDPLTLAIWYQDDGTLDRRSGYHWNARIATYCFPYDDCVRLRDVLRTNFGIEVSVCKNTMRQKVYYELYVLSKSMERFIEIVRPYVHKDYAYKILV